MPNHNETVQSSDGQPFEQSEFLTYEEATFALPARNYAEDVAPDSETGQRRAFHAVWTATVAAEREDEPDAKTVLDAAADVLAHDDADDPDYCFDTYTRALKHLDKRGLTEEPVFTEGER